MSPDNDIERVRAARRDEEFIDLQSDMPDDPTAHDIETCGHCYTRHLHREVAREIRAAIRSGDRPNAPDAYLGAIGRWSEETARRWTASKFVALWVAEAEAGRDPHAAFEAKGWQP